MTGTKTALRLPTDIWIDVATERERAHAKHGDTSMESWPVTDLTRLTILMEEVGEVAREFNVARSVGKPGFTGMVDLAALRAELIQVAAMAGAWADVISRPGLPTDKDEQ